MFPSMNKRRTEPADSTLRVMQKGSSMLSTLRNGSFLDVVPYAGREVRRGDVVVFRPPGQADRIVHRVTAVLPGGVRTQGDNCRDPDPWVVPRESIEGRVVFARWGQGGARIPGGSAGRFHALAARVFRCVEALAREILRPPYRWLVASGLVFRWINLEKRVKVVSYRHPLGTDLHLLLGNRVIGRYLSCRGEWRIRAPYKLFLRESALPRG